MHSRVAIRHGLWPAAGTAQSSRSARRWSSVRGAVPRRPVPTGRATDAGVSARMPICSDPSTVSIRLASSVYGAVLHERCIRASGGSGVPSLRRRRTLAAQWGLKPYGPFADGHCRQSAGHRGQLQVKPTPQAQQSPRALRSWHSVLVCVHVAASAAASSCRRWVGAVACRGAMRPKLGCRAGWSPAGPLRLPSVGRSVLAEWIQPCPITAPLLPNSRINGMLACS